jgi:hypothetical protein
MDHVGLGEAGHRHHRHLGMSFGDGRRGGDTVHAGHQQVHQHHVGRLAGYDQPHDPVKGLLPVGCLADELHVVHRLEIGTQAAADHGVVVDDEHLDWRLSHGPSPHGGSVEVRL